jgi:thymidylate synthase
MNHLANISHYASAQEAFNAIIKAVLSSNDWVESTTDPTSIGSRFGETHRKTKELICVGFAVDNPRARLIYCPARRLDLAFAFANFVWALGGNNDVSSISFYNPKGAMFSEDGKHFSGALGHRMQCTKCGSQLTAVVGMLKKDPASRRAVIQFYSDSDSALRPKDTPCIIAMHLIIREGKLLAIVHMRSQSAMMVMPYDIILFTMLHELIAAELGVELGTYFHISDSLHIYDDEIELAAAVMDNYESAEPPAPMDVMPMDALTALDSVCTIERKIREREQPDIVAATIEFLPSYWRDIVNVLAAGGSNNRESVDIANIHAPYRRWFQ